MKMSPPPPRFGLIGGHGDVGRKKKLDHDY